MRVAIIGTGYVGLTTGVCLAFIGHKVACLDADQSKIDALKAGKFRFMSQALRNYSKMPARI